MLKAQKTKGRIHKGMPLVWISDCYLEMGFRSLAKRYLMLTLCEDVLTSKGDVDPDKTGSYFRLVWNHGLSDAQFRTYSNEILKLSQKHPSECSFPEWILQELNQDWMTELPEIQESSVYTANQSYIRHLISELGDGTGETMERLANYLLSCIPGCRTARRQRSYSTDYDIVCSIEGVGVDFRSELGRYFVCECKDWSKPTDFSTIAKFCRVLDSIKSRFGIIFSRYGISGEGRSVDAERELMKVYQDRGMVIVVIDQNDIEHVASGTSFVSLLRAKFETVRLDLKHSRPEDPKLSSV